MSEKELYDTSVEKIVEALRYVGLQTYLEENSNSKRFWGKTFLSGIVRGIGMAVGFSVLGALILYLIQLLAGNSIEALGNTLADIVWSVQENLRCR